MPRFFVRKDQIENGVITVLGDDAHHISRALRMAKGDKITISDMQKVEYDCVLEDFLPDRVLARIVEMRQSETEAPFEATLYQALPKGEKLDSIIQKSVECGAFRIVTFNSERCIAKEKGDEQNKLQRRNRIAQEAAKQSGRGIVPEVKSTVSFGDMLKQAAEADLALFCYEGEGTESLRRVLQFSRERLGAGAKISIVIGSEGGFSLAEVERARAAGLIPVGLGKRILRTETASSFVLSCLVYELEM
ncbi:MAG: 16S rRNA (uracil(1498)-N(3))-methyltransferase [Clostridia bacterium]|nr:16S rRNA (uracil(1498)-N(3))-methyltransferase [Clostridia bacterium]